MEVFLEINPPTITTQEHKVRVVNGRPMFYDTARLKMARNTFEYPALTSFCLLILSELQHAGQDRC